METKTNHNPYKLKAGDVAIIDKGTATESEVIIDFITPLGMFSQVKPIEGGKGWETMTNRLTPKV